MLLGETIPGWSLGQMAGDVSKQYPLSFECLPSLSGERSFD